MRKFYDGTPVSLLPVPNPRGSSSVMPLVFGVGVSQPEYCGLVFSCAFRMEKCSTAGPDAVIFGRELVDFLSS